MILVYINNKGYYIEGKNIEIARSMGADLSSDPAQYLYLVLACALRELANSLHKDDVCVYNDTRIIEEMSNEVDCIDDTCDVLRSTIRRNILPNIPGIVFFRKASANFLDNEINHSHRTMLKSVDKKHLMKIAEDLAEQTQRTITESALAKFKNYGKRT